MWLMNFNFKFLCLKSKQKSATFCLAAILISRQSVMMVTLSALASFRSQSALC